jgi:hypothetical protein
VIIYATKKWIPGMHHESISIIKERSFTRVIISIFNQNRFLELGESFFSADSDMKGEKHECYTLIFLGFDRLNLKYCLICEIWYLKQQCYRQHEVGGGCRVPNVFQVPNCIKSWSTLDNRIYSWCNYFLNGFYRLFNP